MYTDLICILDFGGNQAYYTARRLRGEQFYCEIFPADTDISAIKARSPKGIILIGGDHPDTALPFEPDVFGVPVLAFGAAAGMLAVTAGAEDLGIQLRDGKEFVQYSDCALFEDLSENDRFFERIEGFTLPEGWHPIASTPSGLTPAFASVDKPVYGLQFYVENNDPEGLKILENFAEKICGCTRDWCVENYFPALIENIHTAVGDGRVLIPVSGGVDSAVAAALLNRAIGGRLTCIFIDSGLMRKGDAELIRRTFNEQMGLNLIVIDAQDRFIKKLQGVHDAAEKRSLLCNEFSTLFSEEYIRMGDVDFMAEGTIYNDLLHNKARLSQKMLDGCRTIEPLKMLFKDEVRVLGRFLGVPEELVRRPSFASSGLSGRCLGEVTPEKLQMLREADAIFRQEVEKAALSRKIAQYFVVLTDMKTPGLHGEGYVCALRALGTSNAGKASAYKLPYDLMDVVVQRITREVPGITHVVYDITGRPTATVEWE